MDTTLSNKTRSYLQASNFLEATIFGGTGAVNNEVQDEISSLINK